MSKKVKMKTRKAVAKRFKRTATGKFVRDQSGHKHELSKFGNVGDLAGTAMVADVDVGRFKRCLPYAWRNRRPSPAPQAKKEA